MPATPIIDAHLHLYPSRAEGLRRKATYQVWEYGEKADVEYSRYGGDVEDALSAIRESPVDRAIVVNLFSVSRARDSALAERSLDADPVARERVIREIDETMGERLKASNRLVCELAGRHPELIPCVAADPWALDGKAGPQHLGDAVTRHGARGVKVHPVLQQFAVDDRRMYPIYQACVELDIPIVAHAGPSRTGPHFAEPRGFVETLRAFPDLRIVLAHLGGGAWRQTLDVARACRNAFFDCCEIIAWTGAPDAPSEAELARLIQEIGADRVLMGSDFPWYDLGNTVERVERLPRLSRDEKAAILGANAMRVFRL